MWVCVREKTKNYQISQDDSLLAAIYFNTQQRAAKLQHTTKHSNTLQQRCLPFSGVEILKRELTTQIAT